MIKKIVICMVAILILGIGLYTAGSKMDDNKNEITNVSKEEKSIKVEEFSNIDISVVNADVEISNGKDYSVKYNFDDQESIKKIEVKNNTLYVESDDNEESWKMMDFDSEGYKVHITIPKDKEMDSVKINTENGDVSLSDIKYSLFDIETENGDVNASEIKGNQIDVITENGDINILRTIGNKIDISTENGDIDISDINEKYINIKTENGDVEYNGMATESVNINSVSGYIHAKAKDYNIKANNEGDIYYNGKEYQYEFIKNSKGPKMIIENVYGDIEIEDK